MSIITPIVNYLRSSKAELLKVSWPTRKDTIRYSTIVLTVSAVVAVFFAALDFGLGKVVSSALASRQAMQRASSAGQGQEVPITAPAAAPSATFDITNESPTLTPTPAPSGDSGTTPAPAAPTTPQPSTPTL